MAYQSLYRRYRPQCFGELRGQDHVSTTLRNAVREHRTSHAYLFSGPRGTGKTSTARILAKALNCAAVVDGEPCNTCTSCTDITDGRSLDVFELDAASNNGVEAMRELVSRAALGTPGRWKVYIVDEAHMLSGAASNALLKTLEEPPAHVVFVLATTEARKVLPTIRSRTQHLEFRLLAIKVLTEHLRWVAGDAGLDLAPEVIDLVARRGGGSVRDALSALDQVSAAGGVHDDGPSFDELVEALCERDLERAMVAIAERCGAGHDPRQLAGDLLEYLRNAFLVTVSRGLVGLSDDDLERVESQARRLGRAATVRSMELLGHTLVDMREAPDPRVSLELALVRICQPETDVSLAALLERIERLERQARGDQSMASRSTGVTDPPPPAVSGTRGGDAGALTAGARAALRSPAVTPTSPAPAGIAAPSRRPLTPAPPPAGRPSAALAPAADQPSAASPSPSAQADSGGTRTPPTRDELTMAWADVVLERLSVRARARFRVGRFVNVPASGALAAAGSAVARAVSAQAPVAAFVLPNAIHRDRCREVQAEVEAALAQHFGVAVPLLLMVESEVSEPPNPTAGSGGPPRAEAPADYPDEEPIDPAELTDAPPPTISSPVDQVLAFFEGATVVDPPDA